MLVYTNLLHFYKTIRSCKTLKSEQLECKQYTGSRGPCISLELSLIVHYVRQICKATNNCGPPISPDARKEQMSIRKFSRSTLSCIHVSKEVSNSSIPIIS